MVIGIHKTTEPFEFDESGWFEHEKPAVLEAFRVLAKEGYYISISGHDYNEREKRLQKEYEQNTKSPGPGEEQPEEKKGIIYPTTFPKADFYYKHVLNEGNPALKEAASQFNDALLDEQAKEIDKQNQEITRLLSLVEKKENSISRLHYEKSVLEKENEELKKGEIPARYFDKALVDEQEKKIKKLEHEKLDILEIAGSCKRISAEQAKDLKRLGKEIARLNKIIHKKNLKIEELRKESSRHLRGKIKMFGENVDLEGKLKDKDAVLSDVAEELRLSKIREKNLTEVGQKYMKENEELKKELDAAKKRNTAVIVDFNAKCMRAARESINDVFESYAAKYAKSTLDELKDKAYESFNAKACELGLVGSKDGNGILDQMVGVDKAEEGGDHSAIISQCCKNIAISKDEAEIIERCTKNGTELHYSEKDGFTYTNMYGEEIPIRCLRGIFAICTDEEYKSLFKK